MSEGDGHSEGKKGVFGGRLGGGNRGDVQIDQGWVGNGKPSGEGVRVVVDNDGNATDTPATPRKGGK